MCMHRKEEDMGCVSEGTVAKTQIEFHSFSVCLFLNYLEKKKKKRPELQTTTAAMKWGKNIGGGKHIKGTSNYVYKLFPNLSLMPDPNMTQADTKDTNWVYKYNMETYSSCIPQEGLQFTVWIHVS